VVFEPFDFSAWKRNDCHLEIVPYRSDNYVDFKAVSLANTSSVNGIWHIVDVGDGLESDFQRLGENIQDKCVLLNLGLKDSANQGRVNLHRAEKVSLALRYGAKALIFVHPGSKHQLLTGTASLKGGIVPVPALCISGPDGKILRDWMKKERLMAEMHVNNPVMQGSARNVMAFLPATAKTRESIVFTAHLDSWDLATGATDNGLGAFTLLDIVRALEPYRKLFRRNLIFIWTMGEEQGLLGSRQVVKKWKDSGLLDDIRLIINLDMVGNPVGFNAFSWPGMEFALQDFHQKVKNVIPDYPGKISHAPGLHSDHQPFLLQGIPSVSGISNLPDSIYECYHANCDNISLIRPMDLLTSAKIHSMLGIQFSTVKKLPFRRFSEKKLVKWLKKTHLKEKLEISGEWRWN
jgi:Iap family predicted aminopeptidase